MTTLYNLIEQDAELYEILSGEDDIPEEQLYSILESSEQAISVKAARVVAVIKQLEHDASGHAEIAKRHSAKSKSLGNNAQRLKDYLLVCMEKLHIAHVGTLEHSAKIPKPRASMKIDDPALIPDTYKTVVSNEVIDNAAVKKALEAGEAIEGAHLEYKKTLRIE